MDREIRLFIIFVHSFGSFSHLGGENSYVQKENCFIEPEEVVRNTVGTLNFEFCPFLKGSRSLLPLKVHAQSASSSSSSSAQSLLLIWVSLIMLRHEWSHKNRKSDASCSRSVAEIRNEGYKSSPNI